MVEDAVSAVAAEVTGEAKSAFHAAVESTRHYLTGRRDGEEERLNREHRRKVPGRRVSAKTRAGLAISTMSRNPCMKLSYDPRSPFPPVLLTDLETTHYVELQNTAIDNVPMQMFNCNLPNPAGSSPTSTAGAKRYPWFKYFNDALYKNWVIYSAVIHVIASQVDATPRRAFLKLHSDCIHKTNEWEELQNNAGTTVSQAQTPSNIVTLGNWSNYNQENLGSWEERMPSKEDNFVTANLDNTYTGARPVSISGHWDLQAHEGVNFMDAIVAPGDNEQSARYVGGETLPNLAVPAAGEPSLLPKWYLWSHIRDNDGFDNHTVKYKVVLQCKVAFFNMRDPAPTWIVQEEQT